jgi:hypothetical protein
MENKKKKINIELLNSTDDKVVIKTIKSIRENGNSKDLNALINLYSNSTNKDIRKSIYQLFCDLKNQDITKIVVQLITDSNDKDVLKMLTSSCWESRLDYSDYFELFINLVITEEFLISFDAFTLLENFDGEITKQRKIELGDYLKNNIGNCKEENLTLAMDLSKIISSYKE